MAHAPLPFRIEFWSVTPGARVRARFSPLQTGVTRWRALRLALTLFLIRMRFNGPWVESVYTINVPAGEERISYVHVKRERRAQRLNDGSKGHMVEQYRAGV